MHYPVPHAPWIFDRNEDEIVARRDEHPQGYLDNLALVDRAIGRLRKSLEFAGLWNNTTVLISSDHGWHLKEKTSSGPGGEYGERKIPFVLHLAGKNPAPVPYSLPFAAIHTKELLLKLAKGEFTQYEQITSWMQGYPFEWSHLTAQQTEFQ